ncbi:D-alanyl-D-alanine dipeptidase [Erwinia sp. OLTSP20]|uniref:D-alanyl-D-alanine dipeptidase n=1 Tax=unclassified Erwinia TaxID=2622719 RepID=UPI000C19B57A|nr:MULTISPECIES: D-alanyl-D-alanine dipeptidase [unclassified Erwinia]PIJ49034.1 D-alanyl-D-alanine dipeptidase [Erwinia sp. OAMSP11]PIJ75028.1 D-alanyl-D-alanine dipeptidase [Erwinia sp. OLSSP12]PIJ79719.1 D-alanyl-D-alanine dipeptidase [Erwinia sp. OLCASP19]PIJ80504.1 D-alanyl-D-alanine dipeptidase [Erwinia sp. OLMTSP26]PIJ82619.1 D-alanyl-D-alanine dipeptidase [Erwinia sp. OLMDSP33]
MLHETQLVDIRQYVPTARIELKYASHDNITGKPIYRNPCPLLHPLAAEKLARSAEIASLAGFTLLVYDVYRPQLAQLHLWRACPNPQFVMPVETGSNHSRGTAVDLTLLDDSGNALDMGAGFDDMRALSHAYHGDVPVKAQRNRLLLNAIMFGAGFVGLATEWWHFELPDAARYPLLSDHFDCYPLTP